MPTKDDILKVARSARLSLTISELDKFTDDANEILAAFEKIKEVDTENVEPSFQPIRNTNIMREDIVIESLRQDEALKNAEHRKDAYFKGPRIT
jgi:aspartyl-tRNA(Asn)/glutamyl-tRNA(Gln) amidotransferase subunit C